MQANLGMGKGTREAYESRSGKRTLVENLSGSGTLKPTSSILDLLSNCFGPSFSTCCYIQKRICLIMSEKEYTNKDKNFDAYLLSTEHTLEINEAKYPPLFCISAPDNMNYT